MNRLLDALLILGLTVFGVAATIYFWFLGFWFLFAMGVDL